MKQLTIAAMVTFALAFTVNAQTTAFSYQGNLADSGSPANGSYEIQFKLFDSLAGPTQIGSTLTRNPVSVTNGAFSVGLDFGTSAFPGADRFLEIAVRNLSGGVLTTLSPRSQLLSSPYAVRSKTVTGPVTGTSPTATLTVTNDQPGITNPSPLNIPPAALRAEATSAINANIGLLGISNGSLGGGVVGIATGGGGGVTGISTNATGDAEGLTGEVFSPDGRALSLHMPTGGTGYLINASSGIKRAGSSRKFSVTSAGQVDIDGGLTLSGTFTSGQLTLANGNIQTNGNVQATNITVTNEIVVANSLRASGATLQIGSNVNLNGTLTPMLLGGGDNHLCNLAPTTTLRFCSSSFRYKTNIREFTGGMDIVKRLRPIVFTWKETGVEGLGLGAEDVKQVEPRLTFDNPNGEVEGIRYNQLGVVLVNAVKQQQEQIGGQQRQIDEQNKTIKRQQIEIDTLRAHICAQNPSATFCKLRN